MILRNCLLVPAASLMVATIAVGPVVAAQTEPVDRLDAALAYSQCMRDNGYAEFPDPDSEGGFQFLINPQTAPRFKAAAAACDHLAPGAFGEAITPDNLEALLKLSQCVRENGVPDFPDPDAEGRYDLRNVGIGPGDSRFEAAMAACKQEAGSSGRIVIGG
ncbi:MAG: hypothetical protein ABIO40_07195 [Devosia sp.]